MNAKDFLKSLSFNAFLAFDRLGIHVLPKHYYTPIPDHQWLRNNKKIWAKRASLEGIHWRLDEQLNWLKDMCSPYYHEVAGLQTYEQITASRVGLGYGPIESQVLHCFMRSVSPSLVVEVGSGVSTAVMLNAVNLNVQEGKPRTQIKCVEPYPKAAFRNLENITYIEHVCQAVPSEVFTELQSGDLLFIDSSHAVKTGSDVIRIYLDIIPKLKPDLYIHIHDMCLPYTYSPSTLVQYFGWQETALVLALLTNNERLTVLACESALHHDRAKELGALLTDYRPLPIQDGLYVSPKPDKSKHFPSSLWLKTH